MGGLFPWERGFSIVGWGARDGLSKGAGEDTRSSWFGGDIGVLSETEQALVGKNPADRKPPPHIFRVHFAETPGRPEQGET